MIIEIRTIQSRLELAFCAHLTPLLLRESIDDTLELECVVVENLGTLVATLLVEALATVLLRLTEEEAIAAH